MKRFIRNKITGTISFPRSAYFELCPSNVLAEAETWDDVFLLVDLSRLNNQFEVIDVTRKDLESGRIIHIGWLPHNNNASQTGINVMEFFDTTGSFIGATDEGLAPSFMYAEDRT